MGNLLTNNTNVVFNFIFGLNFIFLCFWIWKCMIIYDNEFETKENKIETKDEIKPPHL